MEKSSLVNLMNRCTVLRSVNRMLRVLILPNLLVQKIVMHALYVYKSFNHLDYALYLLYATMYFISRAFFLGVRGITQHVPIVDSLCLH
jgi:hypothetical protein